jgi:hypothetical protein
MRAYQSQQANAHTHKATQRPQGARLKRWKLFDQLPKGNRFMKTKKGLKASSAAKLAAKNAALKAKARNVVADEEDEEDDEAPRAKKRTAFAPPPKSAKLAKRRVVEEDDEDDEDGEDEAPKARRVKGGIAPPHMRKRSRVVEEDEEDNTEDADTEDAEAVPMFVRGYCASIRDNLKDVRGWTKAKAQEHASFATADKALVAALAALSTVADLDADEG